MKTLYIIRHAKSSWLHPGLADHDRPPNPRGERDMVTMAEFIKRNFKALEVVYTSTATRALDYAVCINKHTRIPLELNQALYTFSCHQLCSQLIELPDQFHHVGVVGHNPAVTELANRLLEAEPDDKIVNIPTSAIVVIRFPEMESWKNIMSAEGERIDLVRPKWLEAGDYG